MKDTPICDACGQPRPVTSIIGRARICDSCRPELMARMEELREEGGAVSAMAIAQSMRPPSKHALSPSAIRAFLQRYELTGSQAARMAYLSGGQAIRKYTGGANPHRMSGAVWFALHAHVLLGPEKIAEIETAMEEDCEAED